MPRPARQTRVYRGRTKAVDTNCLSNGPRAQKYSAASDERHAVRARRAVPVVVQPAGKAEAVSRRHLISPKKCGRKLTNSSSRSRTRWTGSPLEITSPIVSVMSIKTHGPRQKLTEVRVGSRGRGWRGLRLAHGVEQRGSHEPDLVNLCAGAGASDILFFEVAQSCALVLTREGPLVAID